MSLVDVVVVNYKSADRLQKCLTSVYNHMNRNRISCFIFDNSADSGLRSILSRLPNINITASYRNIGFGAAVNRTITQGQAPYILLINPDTYLRDSSIENAVYYLSSHETVGILGPKILNDDGTIQGSARKFPSFSTGIFGRTSLLSRLFPNNRFTQKHILTQSFDTGSSRSVDWVSGACMLIRRRAIEDVGLLDERFFMYWEDADWCRRMSRKGWQVIYFPKASVYHSVGKSSQKQPVRSILEFHRSAYLLFAKYVTWPWSLFKPLVFGALAIRFYFKLLAGVLKIPFS